MLTHKLKKLRSKNLRHVRRSSELMGLITFTINKVNDKRVRHLRFIGSFQEKLLKEICSGSSFSNKNIVNSKFRNRNKKDKEFEKLQETAYIKQKCVYCIHIYINNSASVKVLNKLYMYVWLLFTVMKNKFINLHCSKKIMQYHRWILESPVILFWYKFF